MEVSLLKNGKLKLSTENAILCSEKAIKNKDKLILEEKLRQAENQIQNLTSQLNSMKIANAKQEQLQQTATKMSAELTSSMQIVSEIESKLNGHPTQAQDEPLSIRMKMILEHFQRLTCTPVLTLGCFSYGHTVAAKPNQHGYMELVRMCSGPPYYFVYHNGNPLLVKNGNFTNTDIKFKLYPNNIIYGRIVYIEEKRTARMDSNPFQLPIGAEYYPVDLESLEGDNVWSLFT